MMELEVFTGVLFGFLTLRGPEIKLLLRIITSITIQFILIKITRQILV